MGHSLRDRHRVLRDGRARHFPAAHPAIPFLLLLAIADDALGLVILAVFYPSAAFSPCARWADDRRARGRPVASTSPRAELLALRHWPGGPVVGGALPGRLSSSAGARADRAVHASRARDLGLFDRREERQADTLNQFAHWWSTPVQLVLLLFGFANAGIPFGEIGPGTYYVLAALLLGKPLGILVFSGAARVVWARFPTGASLERRPVGRPCRLHWLYGVALLCHRRVSRRAARSETKMGALLSFIAAPLALAVARMMRVSRPPT